MQTSIQDILRNLNEPDVYAILCTYLYEFKKIPEYSVLCELAYLLDKKSFDNMMTYFEGQTVKIPTSEEFKKCIRVLLLFQYFEIEKKPWKQSLELAGFETSEGRTAQKQLEKLKKSLDKYNYGNREY